MAPSKTQQRVTRTGVRFSGSKFGDGLSRHRLQIVVGLILASALALRAAAYLEAPRSLEGAGLTAKQGEMARNIVDHGEWFVVNEEALDLLKKRQAAEQRLVDPEAVDFSSADRQANVRPIAEQMPGLALVLSGLWWTTGEMKYEAIQWLQILLDTAMVLLVFWIGRQLMLSAGAALLAALLYAIWPGAIVLAKRPSLDTWAGFFTICCVAAFVWARHRPDSVVRLIPLGVLTGVGIYFRPFLMLLPLSLAVAATPRRGWKHRALWSAVPTAIALLLLSPWTIRNYYEFDRFVLTRTGFGQAVYEGIGQATSDEEAASHVRANRPDERYGSPAYDSFLFAEAAKAIRADPGWYVHLVLRRARYLLPCLLVVICWRRWRDAALIPLAAAVATILPYIFIGDDTRFYLPAAFAYFILISMTTVAIASWARHLWSPPGPP